MAEVAHVVVAPRYGGPEVLELVERELPSPGPGQVHVEVRAVGTNPADAKLRAGAFGTDPGALPLRLGYEAAGVVRAAGEGSSWKRGTEVIAFRVRGAYASALVVDEDALVAKPDGLPWPEAAGLMLTGATAVHALSAAQVGPGDTVLVHGGAGGVGQMAVQLASLGGARVLATAGEANHDLLRELGAEPVRYGDGLLERVRALAPGGVTAALDLVGTDEALDTSLALVDDRGRIATIANFDRGPAAGVRVLGNGPGADPGEDVRAAARPELARLAGAGRLRVRVSATYPLAEASQAHRALESGHSDGKIVLLPA